MVAPNPAERYQTALEMRRAIEKLSYPGHWSVCPTGELIGANGHNEFRFEKAASGSRFSVTARKKNLNSRKETKMSEFCGKELTAKQAEALIEKLIKHVVTGS